MGFVLDHPGLKPFLAARALPFLVRGPVDSPP